MDQKINDYLESLVLETLISPGFLNLPEEQRSVVADKIRGYLYGVIFDMVVDRLDLEQLNSIKDLPVGSPEMVKKIEEFSAFMPSLAEDLETKLAQSILEIKQKPEIL